METTRPPRINPNLPARSHNFYFYEHQHKGDAYLKALLDADWTRVSAIAEADILFTDTDAAGRWTKIEDVAKRGGKVFVYPHSGMPDILPDVEGYGSSIHTTAHFVATNGHAEIMRKFGYPRRLVSTGWSLSKILPFTPRKELKRILFAPIHPYGGYLHIAERDLNQAVFLILYELCKRNKIELRVRYLYDITACGLPTIPTIEYVQGNPDNGVEDMDWADVVIAHQTYAMISIARGVPTIMFGENIPPRLTLANGQYHEVKSWETYKNLYMYPYDILATRHPMALLTEAISTDIVIAGWRERMIGKQEFNPENFVWIVENLL